jgi:hypothetical protein
LANDLEKCLDDFLPLLKLENHLVEWKKMEYCLPLKTNKKHRIFRVVIMALIPCQALQSVTNECKEKVRRRKLAQE